MGSFLKNRGFDLVDDVNSMGAPYAFTWGAEDRCMIDDTLKWIDADATRDKPFFAMTWTQQTHHPYSVSHDQEEMTFSHSNEPTPDRYYRGQYLNALRESDRQLGRLFNGLRQRQLDQRTIVIIVGDHGEAFGWPHNTFTHGARVYDECLHVPFIIWSPKLYAGGQRSSAIGGLLDLGPTILDLCGVAQPPAWQGMSLVDPAHPPRAYFSAVNDGYYLAVRDGRWKYIYNVTLGKEELFDLAADPHEQKNLAPREPDQCQTSRRRLAAWLDSIHKN
jgi:arylsulfatase A-like enzyme